jgi:intergrase/recombinase
MKIKCVKTEKCPICGEAGSCQVFFNKQGKIRYGRVRHCILKGEEDFNPNVKYNFRYCKIEDLDALKTLLLNKGISLSTDNANSGQTGQWSTAEIRDLELKGSSLNSKSKWAGSSARIEHHPPKTSKYVDPEVSGLDLMAYKSHLLSKFTSRSYAKQIFSNSIKYFHCLENPQRISEIPASTRGNVLKAMANLSKFLGVYGEYKQKLKNCGIKWLSTDDAFSSFLRITNHNHSSLGDWYKAVQNILRDNENLLLKYALVTGIRKNEAIKSFNLIIDLANAGELDSYYNSELGILEHYKIRDGNGDFMFLKATKKLYISIVSKVLIGEIAQSKKVSYSAIRKRLNRAKHTIRFKELRSYYATYLRQNGILAEYIDLLQGRIPKSVFARHYLKVEDVRELVNKVNAITATMESSLLS